VKRKPFVALAVIVFAAAVALGIYLVGRQRPVAPPPASAPSAPQPDVAARTVKVYRAKLEGDRPVLRPVEKQVAPGETPIESALRHLLEQGQKKDLANPIPEGTRLLDFKVEKGLATVNLSREFQENFQGGSTAEALVIGSILRTLGQFPEVRLVRLLVEGKAIESLGHLDLSAPLDVNSVGTGFDDGIGN